MKNSIYWLAGAAALILMFCSCEDKPKNPPINSKMFPPSGAILKDDQLDEITFKWDTEGLDFREDIPLQFRLYELQKNQANRSDKNIQQFKLVASSEIKKGNSFILKNEKREIISNDNIYTWEVTGVDNEDKLRTIPTISYFGAEIKGESVFQALLNSSRCQVRSYSHNCQLIETPCNQQGAHWVTKYDSDGEMKFSKNVEDEPDLSPCVSFDENGVVDMYGFFAVMVACDDLTDVGPTNLKALLFKGEEQVSGTTILYSKVEEDGTISPEIGFAAIANNNFRNDYHSEFCQGSKKICYAKVNVHLTFDYVQGGEDYNLVILLSPFENHDNDLNHVHGLPYSSILLGNSTNQQGLFSNKSFTTDDDCSSEIEGSFSYYNCLNDLDEDVYHTAKHILITPFKDHEDLCL